MKSVREKKEAWRGLWFSCKGWKGSRMGKVRVIGRSLVALVNGADLHISSFSENHW